MRLRRLTQITLTCLSLIYSASLFAQVPSEYQIATWKGFASAAATYTWDDNTPNQIPVAIPLFDQYDFKATFFIITNKIDNWEDYRNLADEGYEIASHTLTHDDFTHLDSLERHSELLDSKDTILHYIPAHPVHTFAYPFCQIGTDLQTSEFYISARICHRENETTTPANFMQVSAHVCGDRGNILTTQDFNNQVKFAIEEEGWSVFVLHRIDDDGGPLDISSAVLAPHLAFVDSLRNSVWVGTYGEVVRYIQERDAARIEETSLTNTSIVFQLRHDLTPDIFTFPLTIQRELPIEWNEISVTQDNEELDYQIIAGDTTLAIRFDAIPNGGKIIISRPPPILTSPTVEIERPFNWNVFPNPAKSEATLQVEFETPTTLHIQLIDAIGKVVLDLPSKEYAAGLQSIILPTESLPTAQYTLSIRAGKNHSTRNFIIEK